MAVMFGLESRKEEVISLDVKLSSKLLVRILSTEIIERIRGRDWPLASGLWNRTVSRLYANRASR